MGSQCFAQNSVQIIAGIDDVPHALVILAVVVAVHPANGARIVYIDVKVRIYKRTLSHTITPATQTPAFSSSISISTLLTVVRVRPLSSGCFLLILERHLEITRL